MIHPILPAQKPRANPIIHMKDQMQLRIETLKKEFQAGQTRAADLEAQQTRLRETLLRISGAIQVLEELLDRQPDLEIVETKP
jgi:predicted  nucleic acid-binding Zn-ribbon protein